MPTPSPLPPGPGPTVSGRDRQRARVYAAEADWQGRLDAARRGARRADVAGSSVLLPQEVLFADLAAAQMYADDVVRRCALPAVRLRLRRGPDSAHWEPAAGRSTPVIALPMPEHGTPWALREAVLLHELAHHAHASSSDPDSPRHGPHFTAALLHLVETVLGAEAAFALRVDYAGHRVEVAA